MPRGNKPPADPALTLLTAAAAHGDARAQLRLARRYEQGRGVQPDPRLAMQWHRRAARAGNAAAQSALGRLSGTCERRAHWHRLAAQQGNASSQVELAWLYSRGLGVRPSRRMVIRWLSAAAAQGNAIARRQLPRIRALRGRPDPEALFDAAWAYSSGQGVPRDPSRAICLYRRSAQSGCAEAAFNLGICLLRGKGTPRDPAAAAKWFRIAADRGDLDAHYRLAMLYDAGHGLPRDRQAAFRWFCKAPAAAIATPSLPSGYSRTKARSPRAIRARPPSGIDAPPSRAIPGRRPTSAISTSRETAFGETSGQPANGSPSRPPRATASPNAPSVACPRKSPTDSLRQARAGSASQPQWDGRPGRLQQRMISPARVHEPPAPLVSSSFRSPTRARRHARPPGTPSPSSAPRQMIAVPPRAHPSRVTNRLPPTIFCCHVWLPRRVAYTSPMHHSCVKPSPVLLLTLLALFTMPACDRSHPSAAASSADQLKSGIENKHPATYYELAAKLFKDGKKDEAVFWFYLGQLRYRFHLAVAKNLDPSGDPALFASLSEEVGRPLNQYAFADIPKLAATIDKVLDWDASHDNGFTPKKGNEAALDKIRQGLRQMQQMILKDQDKIRAQRKANGLD